MASVAVLIFGALFPASVDGLCSRVAAFDFSFFVLTVVIGFLIFAGALSADSNAMAKERWPILLFATLGIVLSTALVGVMTYALLQLLGIPIPLIHCFLFGALISPTDPIAVLAILKETSVPKSLQADIAGESLLNDGVAVVVFLTILKMAGGGHEPHGSETVGALSVFTLFAQEVFGGVFLGAVFGQLTVYLMRLVQNPSVDILVSLAAVMGGYALAGAIHVSGPLALVVVGLVVGRQLLGDRVSVVEQVHLSQFWEAIDHILNAVLFSLMGFVLLGLSGFFDFKSVVAGILAIPLVLLARVVSLSLTLPLTKLRCGRVKNTVALLSWGGLRGGISIALALSLDETLSRELILHLTYFVVVFSVLVQGLTISALVDRLGIASAEG